MADRSKKKRNTPNGGETSARRRKTASPHHNVYVVLLDREVLEHRRFRDANPDHNPVKACVYVGMTGKTPEERFIEHQRGYKSNTYVYKYGVRLLPKHFQHLNPMKYQEAAAEEKRLAGRLRRKGYGVWQA
jgi:hypothetical protein